MNKKGKSKGIVGSLFSLFWLMIVAAVIIAFWKVNNIKDPVDLWKYFSIKSQELSACINSSVSSNSIQCSFSLKVGSYIKDKNQAEAFSKENKISFDELKEKLTIKNENSPEKTTTDTEDNSDNKDSINIPKDSGLKNLPATKMSVKEALNKLNNLNVVDSYKEDAKYSRADWKHWKPINKKHSCWNSREESLYKQSFKDMIFIDKNGNETTDKSKACSIKSATWIDPLSGEKISKPGQLDVDHIVPLALAAKSGGEQWDKETKEKYANDPDVLIVTTSKQNRSKGAKSPSEWMPPSKESHCDYAKIYINVLSKYKLNISQSDKDTLKAAIASCSE